ncbi:MAG: right-handed parallel beta-helix repeat-containing protein, partial [Candidatus Thorarchaeota archaeon]
MKKSLFIFILTIILVLTWAPTISDSNEAIEYQSNLIRQDFQQSYDVHVPIVIANNTDFAYQAQLEGWAGNGTQYNPYIIEGFLIDRGGSSGHCIDIRTTTVYFEIRNCHLTGATANGYAAIYLGAVSNGLVSNNNCSSNYYGIYANSGGYNILYNNTCKNNYNGIYVRSSASPTVSNNNCSDNSLYGIYLWGSATTNGVIQDNLCLDNGGNGIESYWTHDTSYMNNTCVLNSGSGIHINIGNTPLLLNNTCNWNSGHGIHLDQSGYYTYHYVRNNTCSNNGGTGIYAQDWTDGEIIKNFCWDNSYGIRLTASDSVTIRNNTLNVHNIGISIDGSSDGNTFNWNAVREGVTNYAIDDGTSNNFNYNFWSNYTGTDSDMDGYGDTPYSIDGASMTQDSYPLILPPDLPPITWNETLVNQVVSEFDEFYYDLNVTLLASLDTWQVNDTDHFTIDTLGVLRNSSVLDPGMYGIEVIVNDSYGNALIGTFSLLVLDFTPPSWIEEPTNRYFRATDPIVVDLDAFDISGIAMWWISDEINFIVDENGVITNVKFLPDAIYPIQVWVNDTSGNTLSAQFNISVDHRAPYRHAAI